MPRCIQGLSVRALGAETGLIMAYYGIPSVSLRDVWFPKWARNEVGFRQRDVMCGQNHPNVLGHRRALPQGRTCECDELRHWAQVYNIYGCQPRLHYKSGAAT